MGGGASTERKRIVGQQLDAHADVCSRLKNNGDRDKCPGYFYNALNKAQGQGLVTPNTYDKYQNLNTQANHAKHKW